MDGVGRLKISARAYQRRYFAGKPKALDISDCYDLKSNWPDVWPRCDKAGVYAIFNRNKKLLYVGKASQSSCIGVRLSSYFRYEKGAKGKGPCTTHPDHEWTSAPRYVLAIAVGEAHQAPSLEEYLIEKLEPIDNTIGKIK